MSSLIALKPRAVALLRAAILFAAKADAREQLTAVCVDPDPAAGREDFAEICFSYLEACAIARTRKERSE